jgi:ATP-dependent helicase/nuclease subunit A
VAVSLPHPQEPLSLASVSYTTLAELERCGYRHYLERVLRLPDARPRQGGRSVVRGAALDARAAGKVAHRLLERIDLVRPRSPSPQEIASAAAELGLSIDGGDGRRIGELLDGMLAAPLMARIGTARNHRRELPFTFTTGRGEPLVAGAIDLIASEPDGTALIVDYKSGGVAPSDDLTALAASRYGGQRLIYALAALREGAAAVEIVHWFLDRPGEPVSARFEATAMADLENELRWRVEDVRRRGYAVSERPNRALCLHCPGRAARLCSWSEERMLSDP